jgi:hypothetical protein
MEETRYLVRRKDNSALPVCSCGHDRAHVISRRLTADGISVELWSDGPITGRFGFALPGVPVVRPRTVESLHVALRAGRLLTGEVCLYDVTDLGDLYDACRWVAMRDGLPGDVRARIAEMRRPRLTPVWTVLSADRDGRPTLRSWRLPRLLLPGVAVWDHVSVGASGGRYEIAHEIPGSRGSYRSSGIRFRTIAETCSHLLSLRAKGT